jgi:catechol 2,3-dioxygenase
VRDLGHVSLYVRDLDATRRFYRDLLGLEETGTGKDGRIVFFAARGNSRPVPGRSFHEPSAGLDHHDLSCELARVDLDAPVPPPKGAPGLYHVAFDAGDSLEDLATARRWVEDHGLVPFGETPASFCVRDPDGHVIELYAQQRA